MRHHTEVYVRPTTNRTIKARGSADEAKDDES
jgi:hypothetical protein